MYYSFPCPYCSKLFCTYNNDRERAAETLYSGIQEHLVSFGEDDKAHAFEEQLPETETNEIYKTMTESSNIPAGGYELK